MPAPIDRTGQRYGRLVVVAETPERKDPRRRYWVCRCDCGALTTVCSSDLSGGNTISCGCRKRTVIGETARTHGLRKHPVYGLWAAMVARCTKPRNSAYRLYGGRGITVCERWRNFAYFLQDMGEPPEGGTLDRIDNDGPYSPENCRWATTKQQCNNRRSSVWLSFNGETRTEAEWADLMGIHKGTLWNRLNRGWTVERALTTPPRRTKLRI